MIENNKTNVRRKIFRKKINSRYEVFEQKIKFTHLKYAAESSYIDFPVSSCLDFSYS